MLPAQAFVSVCTVIALIAATNIGGGELVGLFACWARMNSWVVFGCSSQSTAGIGKLRAIIVKVIGIS